MRQLTEITDDPKQTFDVITEDNQNFELGLEYSDQQQGWFFSIIFGNLSINGMRLTTSPNILRQYKNILPFGISIAVDDLSEPFLIDDFITERVKAFLLTPEEVEGIEEDIYNQ